MRLTKLICADIRFQFKYGFYFVYGVFCALYAFLLFMFPETWRGRAGSIMIYSDPAAIGLFFMGAVVLLEKSQRVLNALAVSPVKIHEYMIGKIVSLAAVSALAALFIALAAGLDNIPTVLAATVLTSAVFTLLGLTAAAKINSLNQYLIVIVPLEVICILPPIIFLFNQDAIARLYPLSASMALISGSSQNPPQDVLIILIIIACLFAAAYRSTVKMWKSCGGVKL